MLRTALLTLFAFATLTVADEKPISELDGTYDLKEFFQNGKGSDEKGAMSTVTFKDGLMTVKLTMREDVAKFTLDTAKKPAQIDFQPTTAEAKTTLGIWKVEKGELTVVFNKHGPRPADFRGTGEGVVKFVMAKPAPKKDK